MGRKPADKNEYEVQKILDSRMRANRQKLYLIRWKGYSHVYDTWQPIQHLIAVKDLVNKYELKQFQEEVARVKEKKYKSQKIRRRFEEMRISLLESKMRSRIQINEEAKRVKKRKKRFLLTLNKRKNKIIHKIQKRKTKLTKLRKSNKVLKEKKLLRILKKKPVVKRSKNKSIRRSLATLNLPKISKSESSLSLKEEVQQQNIEKKYIYNQLQHSKSSIEIEDEQSESQDIQQLIMNEQKVDKAKIRFFDNELFFDIPFKKDGILKHICFSKQQMLKINPGWLNAFFEGFHI